ncbi:hypothetical protein [Nocardia asteroides]|uniref:hypothetical protein n=1 Tax=Nocardia asteroides TaxID=1824 RepID=UPI0033D44657
MNHELDPRLTESAEADDTAPVCWPDPSPLQAWWNDIMAGGDPAQVTRTSGQRAPRLRSA